SFNIGYGYDANGNRSQQTGTAGTTDYTTSPTSNRLDSLTDGTTTQSFSYDANGSLTADGSHTYGYDKTGRLTSVDGSTAYAYNGLGQRVSKTASGTGTVYAYDEAGHLVGEYDASTGTPIQETVWMGDAPLAVVKGSGTYYVHADHLNTPRQINDASGDPVWVWDTITFGSSSPDEDPLATGTPFVYNLRFPGQYHDAETGLHQNHHRDYSSALGRYIQVDPLGLYGGSLSPYLYANQNPLSFTDPLGLAPMGVPMGVSADSIRAGAIQRQAAAAAQRYPAPRTPDFVQFSVDMYVFNAAGTFNRSGNSYAGWGITRQYPNMADMGASITAGWLNQCEKPSNEQVDNFVGGFGQSASGFVVVGGGILYSPGNGTATILGVGGGWGVGPGGVQYLQGQTGLGW
ncbi:hypothetical protein C3942_17885, partial [Solimonas fluminis]